jgi:pimeloyl-ACP methyl ester carboxylesterase
MQAAATMFPEFTLLPFDHQIAGTQQVLNDLADRAAARLPLDGSGFVCGESFGGTVALTLARRHPERVRGLILLSTFAHHPAAARVHARAIVALWSTFVKGVPILAHAARVVGMPTQFGRVVPLGTVSAYLRQPLMPADEYRAKLRLIAGFDARSWLHQVTCPSVVIHGRRDTVVPLRAGRELAKLLPNSAFHPFPCGHLAYLVMSDQVRSIASQWSSSLENREFGLG